MIHSPWIGCYKDLFIVASLSHLPLLGRENMKVLMTGNPEKDLCRSIFKVFSEEGHQCKGVSRATGHDFEKNPTGVIRQILDMSDEYDLFINLYANYFFNGSVLANKLFNYWFDQGYSDKMIINIGSTTDRVQGGKRNLYHYEKRILREMSSGHSQLSVWKKAPRVSFLSLGTLENRSEQNPGRKCLDMDTAAKYILWMTQQPRELHINELSIDPIQ
jgi:hypothetical protein